MEIGIPSTLIGVWREEMIFGNTDFFYTTLVVSTGTGLIGILDKTTASGTTPLNYVSRTIAGRAGALSEMSINSSDFSVVEKSVTNTTLINRNADFVAVPNITIGIGCAGTLECSRSMAAGTNCIRCNLISGSSKGGNGQGNDHDYDEKQRKDFFHVYFPPSLCANYFLLWLQLAYNPLEN